MKKKELVQWPEALPAAPGRRERTWLFRVTASFIVALTVLSSILAVLYATKDPRDAESLYQVYARRHVIENMTTESVQDYAFAKMFDDRCAVDVQVVSNNDEARLRAAIAQFVRTMQARGDFRAVGDVRQIPAMSSLHGVPGIGEWIGVVVTCQ